MSTVLEYQPGTLVRARGREWVVLPGSNQEIFTREEFIQDHAQRIDIDGRTDFRISPGNLLWRHIGGSSDNGAGLREIPAFEDFRQPEVGELRLVAFEFSVRTDPSDTWCQDDIAGFDVSMQNMPRMCMLDGFSQ